MKLTAKERADEVKSTTKRMRREGNIPAIFYSSGQKGHSIEVNGKEFESALRQMKPGRLSTTVFEIDVNGKKQKALVKDIQYDLTSYRVIHLDLLALDDKVPVKVNVPIEFTGVGDCVGIKLGGALRPIIRKVKVKCLPKDIPESFELDIRELKMKQAKRLSDIAMPDGVSPVAAMDEVVVIIAKR